MIKECNGNLTGMMSCLLTFNDIEYLTTQIDANNIENVFNYLAKYDTIIDYIETVKNTIYSNNDNFSFPVKTKKFKGDLLLTKKEFLVNIPKKQTFRKTIDGLKFELKYPRVTLDEDLLLSCIYKINNIIIGENRYQVVNSLPVSIYNQLINFIKNNIIFELDKIIIRNTKNLELKEDFTYNTNNVYKLIFYVCCYNINYLRKIRLILSKEGNLDHQTFDSMTVEQTVSYYKLLKEMYDKPRE